MDQPLRFRWLLRSIVILPWALPTIVNALMWRWIDNAEYGSLNALLTQTGIIHDYRAVAVQQRHGDVDDHHRRRLEDDSAVRDPPAGRASERRPRGRRGRPGGRRRPVSLFRHIILPLITPVVLIVLVLRTMEAFKVFDIIWIMTHGGPANSTQTIAIYAYQTAYQGFDFGRGAALGYLIALVIMVLAAIYLRLLGRPAADGDADGGRAGAGGERPGPAPPAPAPRPLDIPLRGHGHRARRRPRAVRLAPDLERRGAGRPALPAAPVDPRAHHVRPVRRAPRRQRAERPGPGVPLGVPEQHDHRVDRDGALDRRRDPGRLCVRPAAVPRSRLADPRFMGDLHAAADRADPAALPDHGRARACATRRSP